MSHKDVKGKAKLRLVPYQALVEIAKVREFGVAKYGDDEGWKTVNADDFIEAAMRHIGKYFDGQKIDDESGLDHVSHAITSLALAIGVKHHEKH
jgi:hypothetical protein